MSNTPLTDAFLVYLSQIPTTRITLAAALAAEAHRNQKYGKEEEYVVHLYECAMVLQQYKDLFSPHEYELLLCAIWLHDVLEDTRVSYKELGERFGWDIADLVRGVTKVGTTLEYLKEGRERCPLVEPLKLADRIANVRRGQLNRKYRKQHSEFVLCLCSENPQYEVMWDEVTSHLFPEMPYV